MFKWFKRLLNARVSITIVNQVEGVEYSTTPKTIEVDSPIIRRRDRSQFRFVEERRVDIFGEVQTMYSTEEYKHGEWWYVNPSTASKKDLAMELHLRIVNGENLRPAPVKTVLWEGLDKEETATWIMLNK